jgi:hypothetical protein
MLESILAEIDAEIARLQAAKALLSSEPGVRTSRKLGRSAGLAAVAPAKAAKRRTLSAEARDRIRQAQIKRWAAAKKAAKPDVNATVARLPTGKKKAGRSTT